MMSKFMMSCEESRHICDKAQYQEASTWEKIKFKCHLFICKVCKQHTITNSKLTLLIDKIKTSTLTSSEKEQLKSSFNKELQNHQ
ncbi:hypothetical protein [Olleya aquimaris]|jgi:hypothetical protein|uniref:Glycine dehydrogenase n=1 Tax=Olleya aquimaris TaxID=639310 RepID=A0A327RL68_9FLAO|nr:hypothetical protein [Olleya aquimaris]RAJ14477.1 hypothetical protein LY08_01652 [Olleya aquimaris]